MGMMDEDEDEDEDDDDDDEPFGWMGGMMVESCAIQENRDQWISMGHQCHSSASRGSGWGPKPSLCVTCKNIKRRMAGRGSPSLRNPGVIDPNEHGLSKYWVGIFGIVWCSRGTWDRLGVTRHFGSQRSE